MARIIGTNIPDQKRVVIALTYIYGIGKSRSLSILKELNIDKETKVKNLSSADLAKIRKYAKTIKLEGNLKQEKILNIKRLIEINSYRGFRHKHHLPVRGQSSKQNARTCKGPRKTVANKKK